MTYNRQADLTRAGRYPRNIGAYVSEVDYQKLMQYAAILDINVSMAIRQLVSDIEL